MTEPRIPRIRNRTCILHGSRPERKKKIKKIHNTSRSHRNMDYSLSHLKHNPGSASTFHSSEPLDLATGAKNVSDPLPHPRVAVSCRGRALRTPFSFFSFPQVEPLSCEWDSQVNLLLAVHKLQDWQNHGRHSSSLGKLCPSCHFFLELRPRLAKI